jgi:hypothetical protein
MVSNPNWFNSNGLLHFANSQNAFRLSLYVRIEDFLRCVFVSSACQIAPLGFHSSFIFPEKSLIKFLFTTDAFSSDGELWDERQGTASLQN